MSRRVRVELTATQQHELEGMRDHDPKAYRRERAAAILKVAAGTLIQDVAAHGLLRRRKAETVGQWVRAYQRQGLAGLTIRAGRGRKGIFSPSAQQ